MESLDIEPNNDERRRCKFISLRNYSLAICLVEAVAICIFMYLLLNSGRLNQDVINVEYKQGKISSSNVTVKFKVYTSGGQGEAQESVRILLDLYPTCNLRSYGSTQSDKCHSHRWFNCSPIERRIENFKAIPSPASPGEDDSLVVANEHQVATMITTSKKGLRLQRKQILLKKIECKPKLNSQDPCKFSTRLVVQTNLKQQRIIGWGGALTDSSAQNILSLTTNGTRRLLDDYFGSEGLRFNMIRLTIGGSDFSSRFYTNDDSPNDDLKLEKFKLREEDILYKIPLLRFIKGEYGSQWATNDSLKVFASMWSPPIWMKTNGHFNKGQLKGSISDRITASPPKEELYFNALAELKVKFLLAYQQQVGIKFWGLTVMNEPLFAVQPFLNFNTMIFPSTDYANYVVKYLGPKIKRLNPELKDVKLIAHDDNRRYLASYTAPILENQRAFEYIDGVATHSYADEAYHQLEEVYDKYHAAKNNSFFVLPTELCSGHLPFMEKALVGDWNRGMHYALDIVRSLKSSASGWVDWNLVLDNEGGPGWLGGRLDAAIIVDKEHDMYHKSPMFYVLGQFSRYIPPDSIKLQTKVYNDLFDNHFEIVTFALPGDERLATVVVNNNPYPVQAMIKITGDKKDTSLLKNTYYSFYCEPDSVSTIIYSNKLRT